MSSLPPERRTPPEELRARRDQLDAVLRGVVEAIVARDASGRVTYANPAAAAMFGAASADDLVRLAQETEPFASFDALDEAGRPVPREALTGAAAGDGAPVERLVRLVSRATRDERWVLAASSEVRDEQERLQAIIGIYRDVTERKRAADALRVSNEWFATTLKSIGDGVIATDDSGRVTFMNAVAEDLTRWASAEAQGHPLDDVFVIVNETTRVAVESPVTKVLREGVVVGLANHTVLIRRDGSEIAIDDSGAPIRNPEGKLVGVVLVFRDVTAKRREEDRRLFVAQASGVLASSLDYASTLATVARLAVPKAADFCIVDVLEADGTHTQLAVAHPDPRMVTHLHEMRRRWPPSPDTTRGVGYVLRTGSPEIVFDLSDDYFEPLARDAEHLAAWKHLKCRSSMILPLRARGRTLGAITLCASGGRARFDDEDYVFAEQLANAAALAVDNARLYGEAQEASRLKDEFLATVSHELRTPLNAIIGWTKMVRGGSLSPERLDRALATIERNALGQAKIVDDLLDVSRIITGKLRLDVRAADLAAIVDDAVDANRAAAEAKQIRIDVRVDRMIEPISADAARLVQVVWNLVSNAVKFTPMGGRVTVLVRRTADAVEIVVSDTGQGIPHDFLPFVFDRFRQADGSITKSHTGLGLGLSIVKHLVELHGGRVAASSDGAGKGATFVVSLPVRSVGESETRGGDVPTLRLADLRGVRAVVVDDDDDSRELLQTVLEEAGARVRAAATADEALALVQGEPPDVLVSDVGMPGGDGYELIARVRVLPKERGGAVPAIALTAYARAEDRAAAIRAGFQAHVPKPVEPTELAIVVASLARKASA